MPRPKKSTKYIEDKCAKGSGVKVMRYVSAPRKVCFECKRKYAAKWRRRARGMHMDDSRPLLKLKATTAKVG